MSFANTHMMCLILACLLDLGKTPSKVEAYPTLGPIYQGLVRIRGNIRDLSWANYKYCEDLARDLSRNFQMRGYTAESEYYFEALSERHKQQQPNIIQPQDIAALQDLDIPEEKEALQKKTMSQVKKRKTPVTTIQMTL